MFSVEWTLGDSWTQEQTCFGHILWFLSSQITHVNHSHVISIHYIKMYILFIHCSVWCLAYQLN